MIVLGIHDGHNASATLMVDGKIICAVPEERLSRKKHAYGYPVRAIDMVLQAGNLERSNIDKVAMATKTLPPKYFLTNRNQNFGIADFWKEQNEYWFPKIYRAEDPIFTEIFSNYVDEENFLYDQKLIKHEEDWEGMFLARKKLICSELNLQDEDIHVFDHHECHAAYGFFASSKRETRNSLIYTMDGGGDGLNGTVSIGRSTGQIDRISESSNCNVGRMFRYATLLLGMRPADHEYKLMGLAAYCAEEYGKSAYEVFAETLQVKDLGFSYKVPIKDHFFYFKEKLEGMRFDAIAFGIQKHTEEILTKWVMNGVAKTNIRNVIMSGGVAQNVKANKLITELDCVDSLFIPPGPGDESISIGAAYLLSEKSGIKSSGIECIPNAYFTKKTSDSAVETVLQKAKQNGFSVEKTNPKLIAQILADGEVIARFSSKPGEFGARSLGNRSIIADPRNPEVVSQINKVVKMRDFWMPFAPSILEEFEEQYIKNPKKIDARFMAVGFDTFPLAHSHLVAGLHSYDKTARPQIVRKSDNPEYHEIILNFMKITGVGALLNTSFNIHGEPIVETPTDALDTFTRCGLIFLLIDNNLIRKN